MKAVFSTLTHRSQGTPSGGNQPTGRVPAADEEPLYDRSAEGYRAIWTVRGFLLAEIVMFLVLVSIHFGLLLGGYLHRAAGTTESLITSVLVLGLLLTWMPLPWSQRAATVAQSFGTLGVVVGLLTMALGIGPRTILDLSLNVVLLLTLVAGLARLCALGRMDRTRRRAATRTQQGTFRTPPNRSRVRELEPALGSSELGQPDAPTPELR